MPAKSKKQRFVKYHNDGSVWAKGWIGTRDEGTGMSQEGYWMWFRKDGSKMRSGSFEKGKQVGKWTTYDKKGKVVKITRLK